MAKKPRPKKKEERDSPSASLKNSGAFDKDVEALAKELSAMDARMAGIRETKKAKMEAFKEKHGMAMGPVMRALKDADKEGAERVTNVVHYLRVLKSRGVLDDLGISDATIDKAMSKAEKISDAEAAEKAANAEPESNDGGAGSDEPATKH